MKRRFIFKILPVITAVMLLSGCASSADQHKKSTQAGSTPLAQNTSTEKNSGNVSENSDLLKGVSHFVNSTIRIEGDKVIYFDPISIDGEPHDADIIFVTHTHDDHYSIGDIQKIMKDGTILVVTNDGVQTAQDAKIKNVMGVVPNKEYQADGIKFKTVPAYNIDNPYHPKDSGWVGYIVNMNNKSYYIAGDTDIINEMKGIKADVAFLPVGGTYTMDASQAAQAAKIIGPKVAVPIHFGYAAGSREDAEKFINLLDKSISGVILQK
ncbi:MAG: MBL fold metallo-hydrolase [Bacillota bacterium]|nr:MBL fold metallo-hydrolase [Bacillota bacterium]